MQFKNSGRLAILAFTGSGFPQFCGLHGRTTHPRTTFQQNQKTRRCVIDHSSNSPCPFSGINSVRATSQGCVDRTIPKFKMGKRPCQVCFRFPICCFISKPDPLKGQTRAIRRLESKIEVKFYTFFHQPFRTNYGKYRRFYLSELCLCSFFLRLFFFCSAEWRINVRIEPNQWYTFGGARCSSFSEVRGWVAEKTAA